MNNNYNAEVQAAMHLSGEAAQQNAMSYAFYAAFELFFIFIILAVQADYKHWPIQSKVLGGPTERSNR